LTQTIQATQAVRTENDMKRLGIILLGATMLLAQPLSGQKLADPAFEDGSSITYTFVGTEGGRFGPYIGEFAYNGINPVNIYCVDLYRSVSPGHVITADVQNLSDPAGLIGSPGYVGSDIQADLKKAAWLTTKFWETDVSEWKGIHYAIWSLSSGVSIAGTDAYLVSAQGWVAAANANYMAYGNYSDWSLLTTTSAMYGDTPLSRSTQSMLVQSTTVTPEPETYLLMATGLIFLAFFGRRRLKESGYV
jgi:hypothetical protein